MKTRKRRRERSVWGTENWLIVCRTGRGREMAKTLKRRRVILPVYKKQKMGRV